MKVHLTLNFWNQQVTTTLLILDSPPCKSRYSFHILVSFSDQHCCRPTDNITNSKIQSLLLTSLAQVLDYLSSLELSLESCLSTKHPGIVYNTVAKFSHSLFELHTSHFLIFPPIHAVREIMNTCVLHSFRCGLILLGQAVFVLFLT